ncbi:TM2 domain-containing protein 1 isoform X1 [Ochotona curzoniae]|uniref:TM2 domain-containing protein 1 isoform X1 n=1 Tax=Ochotona curzoniae TaxID=130825 RepID=UPI001B346AF8|nr:TM2 domain-containing protein 1 isoform X1 [Ochotona curzoniae]
MAAPWPSGLRASEAVVAQLLGVLWLVTINTGPSGAAATAAAGGEETIKCEDLRVGQYICKDPQINNATQEPVNCTNYTAHVQCFPAPNITCKDSSGNETHFTGNEVGFLKPISCRNVNGYSYKVAVALSLFLGWLGADRFYLGYPALGLLKFCTVGFCGIGSLIDFILISMQDCSARAVSFTASSPAESLVWPIIPVPFPWITNLSSNRHKVQANQRVSLELA